MEKLYGILAEFETADALIGAAKTAREAGFRKMDAYSPYPVHGLDDALGIKRTKLPLIVLLAAIAGAIAGYGLQWWVSVKAYPLNVGGRPLNSWPAFIPITFETTILFAGVAAVVGMLALNGFPEPYHPVFNAPEFERASLDRFFLCIEADDPRFKADDVRVLLNGLGPLKVTDVPT